MLQIALPALCLPIKLQCLNELESAMNDMSVLATIGGPLFVTSTYLAGKYSVLMYLKNDAAQYLTRQLAPSYFVSWPPNMNTLRQIHILDSRVGTLRNVHMVTFKDFPTYDQRKEAKRMLRKTLGAEPGCEILETEPFVHNPSLPMFNLDGGVNRYVADTVLGPAAKSVLIQRKRGRIDQPVKTAFRDEPREPITIVIWVRQSKDEASARTSIPRQIWSALTGEAPPLMNLQPGDRIMIVIEYCSSSAHPGIDRTVIDHVPHDRPLAIITSNPDRLTRRADEVATILNFLDGEWWSQGGRFDNMNTGIWFNVADHPRGSSGA